MRGVAQMLTGKPQKNRRAFLGWIAIVRLEELAGYRREIVRR